MHHSHTASGYTHIQSAAMVKRMSIALALLLLQASSVNAFLCLPLPGAQQRHVLSQLTAAIATRTGKSNKAAAAVTYTPTPNYGDTQGAELYLDGVAVAAGATSLVSGVSWKINKGERVGIVGGNGAGKSTMLSVIAGYNMPEEGTVTVHPRATLGYLVQTAVSGSTRTLKEEAMSQMTAFRDAEAAVARAEARANVDPSDSNLLALERAQALWVEAGGEDVTQRVENILSGLGFQRTDYTRPCTDFSGGWQMRIALARLLLGEPSLLLLDEPTNHLDSAAKDWLMHFLTSYTGTVLLVSHEEELLRAFQCTTVAELRFQALELYRCGYDQFLEQRKERAEALEAAAARQAKERARVQGFIDRFGAKATMASAANSRKLKLEKMSIIEGPQAAVKRPHLRFPVPPKVMPELLKLRNASFGYPPAAPLVEKVDFTLTRGTRMVLLGPNGCGKSTVLKALTGTLPPLETGSSDRILGEGLEMGVFTQDLAQDLPQNQVAVDYVLATVRQKDMSITDQQARGALGALGLMGEKAMRPISALSGGEKARVALSVFALLPHNLLVLDEPSNHLDIGTTETLSEALAEFRGTMVVISHNKAFVEKLKVTHVGLIRNRRLIVEERMLRPSDWAFDTQSGGSGGASKAIVKSCSGKGGSKANDGKQDAAVADGGKANYKDQRARFKKMSAAPKRIAKLQVIIEEKEQKVEEYGKKMYHAGSDVAKVIEFSERKEALAVEVEALYAEWDELEAMLAEKNGQ